MNKKGSAAKRFRQSERRRIRNRSVRTRVRNVIKSFHDAIGKNDLEEAQTALQLVIKLVDTAGRKGVYHKNKVARTKSRLHKQFNLRLSSSS